MVAPGRGRKAVGSPPPALPRDIANFYILLLLPWFLYPGRERRAARASASLGGRGAAVAGFLAVLELSALTG